MMASEPWDVHVHRTTEQLAKTTDATKRAYIYLRRAHLYAQASDIKQSLADLRRCLRLAPSQTEILMQSAQVFEKLGYHDKGERLRVMARAREVAEPVSTAMSRIPMELLIRVLRLLPFVSLVQCRGVCQRWNESIIKHSVFWQAVYIRAPTTADGGGDCRALSKKSLPHLSPTRWLLCPFCINQEAFVASEKLARYSRKDTTDFFRSREPVCSSVVCMGSTTDAPTYSVPTFIGA